MIAYALVLWFVGIPTEVHRFQSPYACEVSRSMMEVRLQYDTSIIPTCEEVRRR